MYFASHLTILQALLLAEFIYLAGSQYATSVAVASAGGVSAVASAPLPQLRFGFGVPTFNTPSIFPNYGLASGFNNHRNYFGAPNPNAWNVPQVAGNSNNRNQQLPIQTQVGDNKQIKRNNGRGNGNGNAQVNRGQGQGHGNRNSQGNRGQGHGNNNNNRGNNGQGNGPLFNSGQQIQANNGNRYPGQTFPGYPGANNNFNSFFMNRPSQLLGFPSINPYRPGFNNFNQQGPNFGQHPTYPFGVPTPNWPATSFPMPTQPNPNLPYPTTNVPGPVPVPSVPTMPIPMPPSKPTVPAPSVANIQNVLGKIVYPDSPYYVHGYDIGADLTEQIDPRR